MFRFSILIALLLCASDHLQAQDTLYMRTGEKIAGKVEEIGLDEIKYRISSDGGGVLVVVAKREVRSIKLSRGQEITVSDDPMDIGYSTKQLEKRDAIKFDFLSPTLQHVTIGYEHVFKPWMNGEVKLGWIGLGGDQRTVLSNSTKPNSGMLAKVGMKFLSTPNYVVRGMRMAHPLKGKYIKPEIMFSTVSTTQGYTYYDPYGYWGDQDQKVQYTNLAFNVVLGWQTMMGAGLTFDMYFGLGYGTQWNDKGEENPDYDYDISDWEPYAYSHVYFGKSFPLVFSTGMTLGWAF